MGAGLVKAAYAAADELQMRDHAPVRLFVFMAVTAVDSDPQPTFYGGREALAAAIAAPRTASGFKVVRDATSALVARGLILVASKAAPGRPTRYDLLDGRGCPLTLNGARSTSPVSESGHAHRAVNNSQRSTLSVAMAHAQRAERGTVSVPPKEEEEKEEETRASAPTRSCRRHPNWEHSDPCRACANDRRAAEVQSASRAPATMSEQRPDCGPGNHRRLPDGTCILCPDRGALAEIA